MKNKWKNYALKDGKIQSSYLREYSSRSPKREASEASCRNSLFQSGEKQEEVKLAYRPPVQHEQKINHTILKDAWVINLKGTENGNDGINTERRSAQETGREQDIQSGISSEVVLDVQDVPEKQSERQRKKRNPKKRNDGPQKQKGE